MDALHEPFAVKVGIRELGAEVLAQRQVHRGLEVAALVVADSHLHARAELFGRRSSHVLDRATQRGVAEERALRSAQHLDAIYFDDAHGEEPHGFGLVDAVDIDGDARHAADPEVGLRLDAAARAALHRQVRRDGVHVADHLDTGSFELFARERRNRQRNCLQAFLTAPCRDDDLFEGADSVLLGDRSPLRNGKRGEHGRRDQTQSQGLVRYLILHECSPFR